MSYQILFSFTAERPLSPSSISNVSSSPSFKNFKPASFAAETCTNTSFSLSSRSIKPYPFLPLNHFTFPFKTHFIKL